MCFMCEIKKKIQGGAEGGPFGGMEFEVVDLRARAEENAELARRTLDAVRSHVGNRDWVHGFLFRFGLDREQLVDVADKLGVDPSPFVTVDQDGREAVADWPGVYEAVVTAATASFEKHCHSPRTENVGGFGELITVLCGKALDAEQRWLDSMRN